MTQFSHSDYMAQQIHEALYALHHTDGYPVEIIAKYANCSTSLIYGYIREVPHNGYRAEYIDSLRLQMAQKHNNWRMYAPVLPAGASMGFDDDEREDAVNHRIEDEMTDLAIAEAKLAVAYRGNDPNEADAAIEEAEAAIRRAKGEVNALRVTRARIVSKQEWAR